MSAWQRRFELRLDAEGRWEDAEALESNPGVVARLGPEGAWLLAHGVRELLSNATRHGGAGSGSTAVLELDEECATATLRLPGTEFDSVRASQEASTCTGRVRW